MGVVHLTIDAVLTAQSMSREFIRLYALLVQRSPKRAGIQIDAQSQNPLTESPLDKWLCTLII